MSVSASVAVQHAGLDVGDLDLSGVTIRMMPSWIELVWGSSIRAITLGDTIFVAGDEFESVVSGQNPGLLLHELVHVNQWRRDGRVQFLWRYVSEYVRNRVIGLDHATAYRSISFEAAAYGQSEPARRGEIV